MSENVKLSYLCGRCQYKYNVWMDSPCVECNRGSNFVEKVTNPTLDDLIDGGRWKVDHVELCSRPYDHSTEICAKITGCIDTSHRLDPSAVGRAIEYKMNKGAQVRPGATVSEVFNTLTKTQKNAVYGIVGKAMEENTSLPEIKDVIFNPPATVVFWVDGTKTVVKAGDDDFDPEKGLAMAISKKALGNKGSYYNEFKKWVEPYCAKKADQMLAELREKLKQISDNFARTFQIPPLTFGPRPFQKPNVEEKSEEKKETASPLKSCMTCAHTKSKIGQDPCNSCLMEARHGNSYALWEPAIKSEEKNEPEKKPESEEKNEPAPDPEVRSCMKCKHVTKRMYDEPCHTCAMTKVLTGRDRTKFEPAEG